MAETNTPVHGEFKKRAHRTSGRRCPNEIKHGAATLVEARLLSRKHDSGLTRQTLKSDNHSMTEMPPARWKNARAWTAATLPRRIKFLDEFAKPLLFPYS